MDLNTYLRRLKSSQLVPKNIQTSYWRNWVLISGYDHASSEHISESIAMGIDKDPTIALLKCLTEFCERKLAKESKDFEAHITLRSDGFAAFPSNNNNDLMSKKSARKNALNEAAERYLWPMWWDRSEVSYQIENCNLDTNDLSIISDFKLKNIRKISVEDYDSSVRLTILLAETMDGGFLTGGAAGQIYGEEDVFSRAFGELLRHIIVFEKMKSENLVNLTFYEERLWGFASGKWSNLVRSRLNMNGSTKAKLPELKLDKLISHNYMDLISIHRCLYHNQLPFIGGQIDRLCL